MNFTRDQLDAVDVARRHLDTCVVAGPGSGKTTVLVEYFRRLVEAGVDPLRILAITFTEKAAGNMRKKLAAGVGGLERAWVSTVHGFCARLLRENAVFAGVDPEFRIVEGNEAWRMQQESIAAAIDALFQEHPAGAARADPRPRPRPNSSRRCSRPTTPCAARACGWRIWPASQCRQASPPARSPP